MSKSDQVQLALAVIALACFVAIMALAKDEPKGPAESYDFGDYT